MKKGDKVVILMPPKYAGRTGIIEVVGGLDVIALTDEYGQYHLTERSAIALLVVNETKKDKPSFVNPFAK